MDAAAAGVYRATMKPPIEFFFDFSSPYSYIANDAGIAAGVFGAPFFRVDGEPFWGNDRQPQIERRLAQGPF
jgi:2-hydroxychromene-2-carboxylate isomerase